MTPAGSIALLVADMKTAVVLFTHNPTFRRRFEREEFRQHMHDEAIRDGLVERVNPRHEVR